MEICISKIGITNPDQWKEKLGAAAQFKKYMPNASVKNIAAFALEDFAKPDWGKLGKLGDFVVVTDGIK